MQSNGIGKKKTTIDGRPPWSNNFSKPVQSNTSMEGPRRRLGPVEVLRVESIPVPTLATPVEFSVPLHKVHQLQALRDGRFVEKSVWQQYLDNKVNEIEIRPAPAEIETPPTRQDVQTEATEESGEGGSGMESNVSMGSQTGTMLESRSDADTEEMRRVEEAQSDQLPTAEMPQPELPESVANKSDSMATEQSSGEMIMSKEKIDSQVTGSGSFGFVPGALSVIEEEKTSDFPTSSSVSSSASYDFASKFSSVDATFTGEGSAVSDVRTELGPSQLGAPITPNGDLDIREFIRLMMHPSPSLVIETIDRTQSLAKIEFVKVDHKGNVVQVCGSMSKGSKPSEVEVD